MTRIGVGSQNDSDGRRCRAKQSVVSATDSSENGFDGDENVAESAERFIKRFKRWHGAKARS